MITKTSVTTVIATNREFELGVEIRVQSWTSYSRAMIIADLQNASFVFTLPAAPAALRSYVLPNG